MQTPLPIVDVFLPRRGARLWSYACGGFENKVAPGYLVTVPFGKQSLLGVIASEPRNNSAATIKNIRQLTAIHDINIFPPDLWQTLTWVERYYLLPRGRVLEKLITLAHWHLDKQSGTPYLLDKTPRYFKAVNDQRPPLNNTKAKAAWQLFTQGPTNSASLAKIYANPAALIHKWSAKGYIQEAPIADMRQPAQITPLMLNPDQQAIADQINSSLHHGPQIHLIYGITGSGKTEVYSACIRHCLDNGKSALVLVPEIALVPALIKRLKLRLGERIFAWHSALNQTERALSQRALNSADAVVLVGARSALFAPIRNLGLLVIDEEHDSSLQLSEGLALNIRDAAIQRAKFAQATALLGSATPSLELYQRARHNRGIKLHCLNKRATAANLAKVTVIDCSQKSERGSTIWLTRSLESAIADRLTKNEQVVLFRNRRGYHPVLICSACKTTIDCRACTMPLTLHARPINLRCHLCGYSQQPPTQCPHCQAAHLKPLGTGTQRIVEELAQLFPLARIERLDRDRMTSQARLESILSRMAEGKIDILVGTQMVTKGMDVANITLVGVINIDGLLHQPDFRASEQCFQHLCQVAGRSGRGAKPGQVIIQTWHPEHPVIQAAILQDYMAFAEAELLRRQTANYPPYTRLVRLLWQSDNKYAIEKSATAAIAVASASIKLPVLGPAPCAIEKIKNTWRWHALARSNNINALRHWALAAQAASYPITAEIEIDPYNLS